MRKFYTLLLTAFVAMNAFAQEPVINQQPEGTLRSYTKTAEQVGVAWDYQDGKFVMVIKKTPVDGINTKVVFADDNKTVYIQDPIFANSKRTWVKGTIEGNTVTVETPQTVCEYMDGGMQYEYLNRLKYDEASNYYVVDADNTSITYTLDENGVLTQTGTDVVMGIVVTDKVTWSGYAETNQVLTPVTDEVLVAPEGVDMEEWNLTSDNESPSKVNVGISGSDVYISGLFPNNANACIKGTITGENVEFASNQYLGGVDAYHFYLLTKDAANELCDKLVLAYDAANKIISGQGTMVISKGKTLNMFMEYVNPVFAAPNTNVEIGNPVNPSILEINWQASGPWVTFDLPVADVNGNVLDKSKLFYNIYAGDDVYTFRASDYDITTGRDMTDVPYDYIDNYYFQGTGTQRKVKVYAADITKVGVQLIYKDGSEVYFSDVVYQGQVANPETPLISSVTWKDSSTKIFVKFPKVDKNGNALDPAKMYYRIYADGELYTFTNIYDANGNPVSDMTDVPYNFVDYDYDIYYYASEETHGVKIYAAPAKVSVVSVYKDGDKEYVSEAAESVNPSAGIEQISADVVYERLTDAAGRELKAPVKGLNIRTVTYSDGTKRSFKVMVK